MMLPVYPVWQLNVCCWLVVWHDGGSNTQVSEKSCQGNCVTAPSLQVLVSCFDLFAPLKFGGQLSVFSIKVEVQIGAA
jgi:hypothetical protein